MEILIIINIIAVFLISLLSGLGVGSGGLLVIWLTSVLNMPQNDARSYNLLFFLFSATSALIIHSFKRDIKLPLVFMMAVFGISGAVIGTNLGLVLNPTIIKKIFGGMLFFSGVYTLFASKKNGNKIINFSTKAEKY